MLTASSSRAVAGSVKPLWSLTAPPTGCLRAPRSTVVTHTSVIGTRRVHMTQESDDFNGIGAISLAAVPAPITVNIPEIVPGVYGAPAAYNNTANIGAQKGKYPPGKLFVSGIFAGAYIAFGAFLALFVGSHIPALATANYGLSKLVYGLVFPVGLMMVTLSGVELYTGNTAACTIALYEKKISVGQLLKNWTFSYLGNFVGSLLMAWAVFHTGLLGSATMPLTVAQTKSTLPFATVMIRSILCNWLVCVAVWQANAATTLPGKVMGLWPPIAAFVTIGLEHSVANMFFIPLGMLMGAKVTFAQFLMNNLIPVTIGNTIAGACILATGYAMCYGTLGKKLFGAGDP